jgi:hypothetical protein
MRSMTRRKMCLSLKQLVLEAFKVHLIYRNVDRDVIILCAQNGMALFILKFW